MAGMFPKRNPDLDFLINFYPSNPNLNVGILRAESLAWDDEEEEFSEDNVIDVETQEKIKEEAEADAEEIQKEDDE